MTPIKRRKRQKFAYGIFACKISCHHALSEDPDIVKVTGNFTCKNMISKFLLFSTLTTSF